MMILHILFILLLASLVGASIALMRFPTQTRLQARVRRQAFFFGLSSIILMGLFWLIFMYPNWFLLIFLALWMSLVLLQLVMLIGYGGAASYPRLHHRKKKSRRRLLLASGTPSASYDSSDGEWIKASKKGAQS